MQTVRPKDVTDKIKVLLCVLPTQTTTPQLCKQENESLAEVLNCAQRMRSCVTVSCHETS